MLHNLKKTLLVLSILWASSPIIAQTEVSGFFPEKGKFTIAPNYTYKDYDQFYRASKLNPGNPAGLGKISSYIVNLYGEYAITDWLTASVNLPYISIESGTDALDPVLQESSTSGLQDLSVFVKGSILNSSLGGNSSVRIAGVLGGTIPVGGYESKGILSLGNGAMSINGRLLTQFTIANQMFFELQGGYSLRNSSDFEVPDALVYAVKFGYYNKFVYWHAQIARQDSMDGTNIGFPDFQGPATLPETEVDYTNFIFNIYFPLYKDMIGISATYTKTIDGRNFGRESGYSLGLVYKSK